MRSSQRKYSLEQGQNPPSFKPICRTRQPDCDYSVIALVVPSAVSELRLKQGKSRHDTLFLGEPAPFLSS